MIDESGAVLLEQLFVYQGIGYMLVQAIVARDYPVIQGIFLVIAIAVVLLANVTPISRWIPAACFYASFALVIGSGFNYIYRVSRFVEEARQARQQGTLEP